MKKKLILVVLAVMVIMLFAACASSGSTAATKESPNKAEAMALYDEVNTLRTESMDAGDAKTQDDFGRAESIYELGRIYMEKGMYTEALQPLGQAKTYFSGYLGK